MPCKNVSSDICGQRRPRSACAFAQSNQGLRCPQSEQLNTIKRFNIEQIAGGHFAHAWGISESIHFAHARRHTFAFFGPRKVSFETKKLVIMIIETNLQQVWASVCGWGGGAGGCGVGGWEVKIGTYRYTHYSGLAKHKFRFILRMRKILSGHLFSIVLRPVTPTFDYLPWQISHSLKVYIQSLTTVSGSWLFGSVVRALDFTWTVRVDVGSSEIGLYFAENGFASS